MKSCAFFGHRSMNVEKYRDRLTEIITDLIENKGGTRFYSGFRGNFDVYCSCLIQELKARYPHIKNTMVLPYRPGKRDEFYGFELPKCFDDSVYLLDRKVPMRLAIIETNKMLVDMVDYVVAGVLTHFDGAYMACEYAYKHKKTLINVEEDWKVY